MRQHLSDASVFVLIQIYSILLMSSMSRADSYAREGHITASVDDYGSNERSEFEWADARHDT
jgi:hypothetical protein